MLTVPKHHILSTMQQQAGVFVAGTHVPGSAIQAFLARTQLNLEQLQFNCSTEAAASLGQPGAAAKYEVALVASSQGAPVSSQLLASVSKALAPGATLYLYEQDAARAQQAQKELLLGGYLDAQALPADGLVTARKPSWEVGAKAALSLKRPAAAAPAPAAQAWKLSAADDGEELVDEDELLTEEDKKAAPSVPAGDCSTSRKACKNCSCGRAEAEAAGEKPQLTQAMLDNPQTNCGNCALGDAFRCAGCPYRGLPTFEPGKKITLSSDFLTADA